MSRPDKSRMTLEEALAGTLFTVACKVGEAKLRAQRQADIEANYILGGFGEREALIQLAGASWDIARDSDDKIAVIIGFVEALTFTRLACAHGEKPDRETLLFLLSQFARHLDRMDRSDLGVRFEAAALNIAGELADEGDEAMADMIVRAGAILPSAVFTEAQRQKESTQ